MQATDISQFVQSAFSENTMTKAFGGGGVTASDFFTPPTGSVWGSQADDIQTVRGFNATAIKVKALQFTQADVTVYCSKEVAAMHAEAYGTDEEEHVTSASGGEHANVPKNYVVAPVTHRIAKLLDNPNPWTSASMFKYEVSQQIDVHGVAVIVALPDDNGKPFQLYVIPRALCHPVAPCAEAPSGGWRTMQLCRWFGASMKPDGNPRTRAEMYGAYLSNRIFDAKYVITCGQPSLLWCDEFDNPSRAMADVLDADQQLHEARRQTFENAPSGGTRFTTEKGVTLTRDEQEQIVAEYQAKMAGARNAGASGFTPPGVMMNEPQSAKDMDYVEGSKEMRDSTLAQRGVPPAMIGLGDLSSYASIETTINGQAIIIGQPLMRLVADQLEIGLKTFFGAPYNEFCIRIQANTISDPERRLKEIEIQIGAQVLEKDEIREHFGRKKWGGKRGQEIAGQPAAPEGGAPAEDPLAKLMGAAQKPQETQPAEAAGDVQKPQETKSLIESQIAKCPVGDEIKPLDAPCACNCTKDGPQDAMIGKAFGTTGQQQDLLYFRVPRGLSRVVRDWQEIVANSFPVTKIVDDLHCSVLYPVLSVDVNASQIAATVEDHEPFEVQVGNMIVFRNGDADVIVMEIVSSDLKDRKRSLQDRVECGISGHLDYRPHVTLAYCKPGSVPRSIDGRQIDGLTGEIFEVRELVLTDDGLQHVLPMGGTSGISFQTTGQNRAFTGAVLKSGNECGANGPGGGGFQPGNKCGDHEGDGTNDRSKGSLPTTSTKESGVEFETGKKVTFNYIRNTEKSPKAPGNDPYQQKIEPHGRYLSHNGAGTKTPPKGWEVGEVTFNNPLVIKLNTGDAVYDDNSWKKQLEQHYGKTGKALSKKIAADGHDGIVTVDKYGTSEIVDLSSFHKSFDGWSTFTKDMTSNEQQPDERAELIADVLFSLYGDAAVHIFDHDDEDADPLTLKAWDESRVRRHKKGLGRESGRFAPKNAPENVVAVHEAISKALKGQRSAESAKELAQLLETLTVAQLRDLKSQYQMSASGRTKSDLVAKIAQRLDSGRRTPEAELNMADFTESEIVNLQGMADKIERPELGRIKTALQKLSDRQPLQPHEQAAVVTHLQNTYNTANSAYAVGDPELHRRGQIAGGILEKLGVDPQERWQKDVGKPNAFPRQSVNLERVKAQYQAGDREPVQYTQDQIEYRKRLDRAEKAVAENRLSPDQFNEMVQRDTPKAAPKGFDNPPKTVPSGREISLASTDRVLYDAADELTNIKPENIDYWKNEIDRVGIENIEPPTIGTTADGKQTIVNGRHRLLAAQELGYHTVPAFVPETTPVKPEVPVKPEPREMRPAIDRVARARAEREAARKEAEAWKGEQDVNEPVGLELTGNNQEVARRQAESQRAVAEQQQRVAARREQTGRATWNANPLQPSRGNDWGKHADGSPMKIDSRGNVVEGEVGGIPITSIRGGMVSKVSDKTQKAIADVMSDPVTRKALDDAGIKSILIDEETADRLPNKWTMAHSNGQLMINRLTAERIAKRDKIRGEDRGIAGVIHHEAGHGLYSKATADQKAEMIAAIEAHPEVREQISKKQKITAPADRFNEKAAGQYEREEVHAELNAMRHYNKDAYQQLPERVRNAVESIAGGKPQPAVLQKRPVAMSLQDDEPFVLLPPKRERKPQDFGVNENGKQGALFDTGKPNELPGQNLLFNSDAGDMQNPRTMENRVSQTAVKERPSAEDRQVELFRRSPVAVREAVTDKAKEIGVNPVELSQVVDQVWKVNRDAHLRHEELKQNVRYYMDLNASDLKKVENNNLDHDTIRGYDDSAQEVAGMFPEIANQSDPNDYIWQLLREGRRDPKPKHHPDIIAEAASIVQSPSKPVDEFTGDENEWLTRSYDPDNQ